MKKHGKVGTCSLFMTSVKDANTVSYGYWVKFDHIVAVLAEFNLFVTEKTFCTAINWKINYFLVIAFLWTFFGPFWSILSWSCCFWDFYFLKIHDNPNNSLSRLIVDYHWSFPLFFSLSTKTKGAISFRVCYFGLCGSLHVQWNF